MSTSEEIYECFCEEVAQKTKIVLNKHGLAPFLEDEGGCSLRIFDLSEGLGAEKIVCSEYRPREKRPLKKLRESRD